MIAALLVHSVLSCRCVVMDGWVSVKVQLGTHPVPVWTGACTD